MKNFILILIAGLLAWFLYFKKKAAATEAAPAWSGLTSGVISGSFVGTPPPAATVMPGSPGSGSDSGSSSGSGNTGTVSPGHYSQISSGLAFTFSKPSKSAFIGKN